MLKWIFPGGIMFGEIMSRDDYVLDLLEEALALLGLRENLRH